MTKSKIAVISGDIKNRKSLSEILYRDFDIAEFSSAIDALDYIITNNYEISLVLIDLVVMEMDAFQTLQILKLNTLTATIPVIVLTSSYSAEDEVNSLGYGAADFIVMPFNNEVFLHRVKQQILLKSTHSKMTDLVNEQLLKIDHIQDTIIDFLATVIEYRDNESGHHIKRTRLLVKLLFEKLYLEGKIEDSCTAVDQLLIVRAVPLHDIGKIAIPDTILKKPGELNVAEFELMKRHTWLGAEILKNLKDIHNPMYLKHAKDICMYHHEKMDGTGYPNGLAGKEIPYSARIMAIIDVYDALTSKRPYKDAYNHNRTLLMMNSAANTHFDPLLVEVFLKYNQEFKMISEKYAD